MTERKAGKWSMVMLFLNLSLAKYLLVVPAFIVGSAGNSAWIVLLLKGIGAAMLFWIMAALYKPYVGLGLAETGKRALGKFWGALLNLLAAGVIGLRAAFLFRTLCEALRALEAENSTIEYMALFILIPVLICALKGFNVNVNMSILILPFTLISVAVIALALIPRLSLDNIMPFFGGGEGEILKSAFLQLGGMFEIIYLFIFSRFSSGIGQMRQSGFIGICAVTLIGAAFTLMYCLAIPYPASKEFFFPLYQLTRLIKAGAFMQRMEPVVIFIWAGIIICALSTAVIAVCELLRSAVGENDRNGFTPMVVMLLFLAGAAPKSELGAYELYRRAMNFSHYFYIIFIFLILIAARARRIEGGGGLE